METPICQTCKYFTQHYYLDEQYCSELECGHCVYPRLKHRNPSAPACKHYAEREKPPRLPDRKDVIHFLTTEFLQHILTMKLPPEIKTAEDKGSE